MLFTTLVLAALPLTALAGTAHREQPFRRQSHNREFSSSLGRRNNSKTFQLVDKYKGQTFFDGFDFFTAADPTHGNVEFVSQEEGASAGLAFVQPDNTVVMAVDDTTQLAEGQNRKSVRIQSKKTYSSGLFIADIFAMPHGCSVWPAWWMVGPNWPTGGEIDILEGVHDQTFNQYTLHTADGCTLNPTPQASTVNATTGKIQAFTSKVLNTQCESGPANNAGCAFLDTDPATYGHGFNMLAGGVFATRVDGDGVAIWHFARGAIPADIDALQPNPDGWGVPSAFFSASTCDPGAHFSDMQLVFDITLCGDWAGPTYASAGCPGTCASAVANPDNYKYAKWKVNYVAVYQ